VPGEDRVHRVVHLFRLREDLVSRPTEVGVQGARVREHHDGPNAPGFELGGPAVHRLGDVCEAELLCRVGDYDLRGLECRHPDKADLDPVALHDGVGRQDGTSRLPVEGVGSDVGKRRPREVRLRGVLAPLLLTAPDEALHLLPALVELVVAQSADVEAHLVHRKDGRLVVEVGRDER